MQVNRDTAVSLYQQIADALTRQIEEGAFAASGKLPSEHALMERFQVSRVTVRQAIDCLLRDGHVVKKQGKGTFVKTQKVQHDLHTLRGFYDALIEQGIEPRTRLLEFSSVTPPPAIRKLFGDVDGPFFRMKRVYMVDEAPIALAWAYLPPEAARVSWEQADIKPVYSILEHVLDIRVTRANVRIRVQQAGAEIGKALGFAPSAPVLVMERESFDVHGAVKEQTTFYIRPDRYEFTLSSYGPLPIGSSIREVNEQTKEKRADPARAVPAGRSHRAAAEPPKKE
ncbi:GntR family transcriptional regulator [Imbroritus primus]|jgi:GntR family transcriptional regulator|uniref:GntR family transcriptional regulator n=1 Tax=Imbroritus primus TaxID=3058603 RepID=UPI0002696FD2